MKGTKNDNGLLPFDGDTLLHFLYISDPCAAAEQGIPAECTSTCYFAFVLYMCVQAVAPSGASLHSARWLEKLV